MKGTNQQVLLQWQKAAASQCFQSKTAAETSTVCPGLLWRSSGFLLQAYVKGKYQQVSLQWQKAACQPVLPEHNSGRGQHCVSRTAVALSWFVFAGLHKRQVSTGLTAVVSQFSYSNTEAETSTVCPALL